MQSRSAGQSNCTQAEVPEEPSAVECERALLGAALHSSCDAVNEIMALPPEAWSVPAHRSVAAAVQAQYQAGMPVNLPGVVSQARRSGDAPWRVGAIRALADLMEAAPLVGTPSYYARMVAEAYTRRRVYRAGQRLMAAAEGSATEVLADLLHQVAVLVPELEALR